jgi:hypothetical protein
MKAAVRAAGSEGFLGLAWLVVLGVGLFPLFPVLLLSSCYTAYRPTLLACLKQERAGKAPLDGCYFPLESNLGLRDRIGQEQQLFTLLFQARLAVARKAKPSVLA